MKNAPDPQKDVVRQVLESTNRTPEAEAAHRMVTEATPDQAAKLIAAVRDQTQYVIGKSESATESILVAEGSRKLSPEEVEKEWLGKLKKRFSDLPKLHKGMQWAEVEKSLEADPEAMAKLQALDAKGQDMNVFGEVNGELIFASAWDRYENVSEDHRNITYNLEAQKRAESSAKRDGHRKPNGNAVDIAKAMGVDLADGDLHEQLKKVIAMHGCAWLNSADYINKPYIGVGHDGQLFDKRLPSSYLEGSDIIDGENSQRPVYAFVFDDDISFRAMLKVKKA